MEIPKDLWQTTLEVLLELLISHFNAFKCTPIKFHYAKMELIVSESAQIKLLYKVNYNSFMWNNHTL